jgi:hypothetical protein
MADEPRANNYNSQQELLLTRNRARNMKVSDPRSMGLLPDEF